MPKYLIERKIPGAEDFSPQELQAISQKSCGVWIQSYVTKDRITCVYIVPNEEILREHARRGGFPADRVLQVKTIFDPTTAETGEAVTAAQ